MTANPKNNKRLEETRHLRVVYTDAERLELGKQLAGTHGELNQINGDLDRIKAEYKAKIADKDAKISDLSNKVSTGFRIEPVACLWEMDKPKKNKKSLRRIDTQEVIETHDMTAADKQAELPLTEMEKKLNEALPAGTTATVVAGVAGDGNVTVAADTEAK